MVASGLSAESTHWTAFRRPRRTMRRFRMFGAGVTIAALLGAVASTGTAGAATPTGVGTSKATDSILKVALGSNGSLLNLRLLGDDGSASIDPTVAKPSSASSGITAASVTSSISALNLGSIGVFNAQSTGDPKTVNAGPVSLALPTADAGVQEGRRHQRQHRPRHPHRRRRHRRRQVRPRHDA